MSDMTQIQGMTQQEYLDRFTFYESVLGDLVMPSMENIPTYMTPDKIREMLASKQQPTDLGIMGIDPGDPIGSIPVQTIESPGSFFKFAPLPERPLLDASVFQQFAIPPELMSGPVLLVPPSSKQQLEREAREVATYKALTQTQLDLASARDRIAQLELLLARQRAQVENLQADFRDIRNCLTPLSQELLSDSEHTAIEVRSRGDVVRWLRATILALVASLQKPAAPSEYEKPLRPVNLD